MLIRAGAGTGQGRGRNRAGQTDIHGWVNGWMSGIKYTKQATQNQIHKTGIKKNKKTVDKGRDGAGQGQTDIRGWVDGWMDSWHNKEE